MKKTIYFTLATFCMIFILANTASALDISLAWDASPGPDVVGYKLYYQAGSPSLPLDGSGALQGPSPIDVGNNTGFSITELSDSQIYYFAVTAYDAAGYESAYSNILASGWVPPLVAPTNGLTGQQTAAATFQWETAPANLNLDVTYTLYYGTDPQLTALTPPLVPEVPNSPQQKVLIFFLLLLSGLTLVNSVGTKSSLAVGAMTLALGLSVAGCGGGGGSTDAGINPIPGVASTVVVNTGTNDYHVALDLEPATTYYWKVIANDQSPAGLRFESMRNNFTTAGN